MNAPRLIAPDNACDCHIHIYDHRKPLAPNAAGPGPAWADVDGYRGVQRALGLTRSIVVQPTAYGFDNSATTEAIAALGLQTTRGVAVIGPDTSEAELARLTSLGICGARCQMLPGGILSWDAIEQIAHNVAAFGWHLQLQMDGRFLEDREALLRCLPTRLVIDHIGKFLEPVTLDHSGFQAMLRLIERGNTWLKLAAPYEVSRAGPPLYADVGALASAAVAIAPERMIWASNWPHVAVETPPDDAALLDLLLIWAQEDSVHQRILVDNPAALYGF